MARVTIDSLRKEYDVGRVVAVEDLDLEIDDGEFVTVVGPSGCGKTTTLRMLAGLETPTNGRIEIGGRDVTDVHAKNRDVAMVFQNYALYPHKTVFENMEFGLRMSTDMSEAERERRVVETAEMMDIDDLLEDEPDELSGGQKQRVALGRAIVREPDVFLFDEPLSNLDAKLRTSMRAEIQRLQEELDITAVYVTHDQEEAMTMEDKIVILKDGKLQQVGHPNTVYDEPANRFVGGFIGSPSMNFVRVTVRRPDDRLVLTDDEGFRYPLSLEYSRELPVEEGDTVVAGIRPEHVEPTDGGRGIETTVRVVEPVGSDNYLYLDLGDDVDEFMARVDADFEPEPEDRIGIAFDEKDLRLFDDETGESLLHESAKPTTPTP
ncbi:ABC transporter ATP-binding protein [Haloterrigena alkaliphila]|uniref:ABC-type D-xylose/L-arabinose transporter n=1 Tax=Haloterrigena alkaliphila TaxID=2816475 RepID=A0A8A2VC04_9EURY|nr:ABC transporter ATP-binding protein [Haloterrigena alkaliphila]QSW99579.1 ABC transporter ATP-binding protein [Haloterrigena alkaliphila]